MEHSDLTEKIIGVFYDVYNTLGYGFLESVYKNAMLIALQREGIQAVAEHPIEVRFHGVIVGEFRVDIVVENKVILELKCSKAIDPIHVAQTLNYLKASEIDVGLILNFGPKPQFERLFFNR
jgi:GxxExxY protein